MNAAEILSLVTQFVPGLVDPSIEVWKDGRSGYFKAGAPGKRRVVPFDSAPDLSIAFPGMDVFQKTETQVAQEIAQELRKP